MPRATIKADLSVDGKKTVGQVKTIGGQISKALGGIKSIGGLIGGMGAGYIIQDQTRKVANFDLALSRMAVQAGKSDAELKKMSDTMRGVAMSTAMSKEEQVAAAQSLIDSTGDWQFTMDMIDDLAVMAQVTGSEMGGLGTISANMFKLLGFNADQASNSMRVLMEQGKKGSWTLNEQADTLVTALVGLSLQGRKTEKDVAIFGAEMQLIEPYFSSAEKAAQSYQSTIATLKQKQSELGAKGISFSDPGDPSRMLALHEIMANMFEVMSEKDLTTFFGRENLAGMDAMRKSWLANGKTADGMKKAMGDFINVSGDASKTQAELDRILGKTGGSFMSLKEQAAEVFSTLLMDGGGLDLLGGAFENLAISANWMAGEMKTLISDWRDILNLDEEDTRTDEQLAKESQAARSAAMNPSERRAAVAANVFKGRKYDPLAGYGAGEEILKWATEERVKEVEKFGRTEDPDMARRYAFKRIQTQPEMYAERYSEYLEGRGGEEKKTAGKGMSPDDVRAIEKAVEKGAKAGTSKIKVFIPNPLKDAGGTTPAPLHGD